jgi:hypothetical protein
LATLGLFPRFLLANVFTLARPIAGDIRDVATRANDFAQIAEVRSADLGSEGEAGQNGQHDNKELLHC